MTSQATISKYNDDVMCQVHETIGLTRFLFLRTSEADEVRPRQVQIETFVAPFLVALSAGRV